MALFLNWKNGGKIWGRSLYQWLLVATVQIQEEACILQLFIRLENSSKNNAYIHVWCISNHSISTVGYAKNQAVEQSSGVYLCFQDIVSFTKICLFYEQYKMICVLLFVLIQSIVIDYQHCSFILKDDVMSPDRVSKQHQAAGSEQNSVRLMFTHIKLFSAIALPFL